MADWKGKLALTAQQNRQEIVKAKLNRREMMRHGLLTAGGSLVVKAGLSSRAFAQNSGSGSGSSGSGSGSSGSDSGVPASPPTTPWAQPLPRPPLKRPVAREALTGGPPDGTALVDEGQRRVPHQFFNRFPPTQFYELFVREATKRYHPSYSPTTIWGFDGVEPGPLIRARYGEPVLLRIHNNLPPLSRPQNFGVAQITTHLHNAHTPSESDGHPIDYYDPGVFKDYHYLSAYAGFQSYGGLGDPREALGSLWYHDHRSEFTAQNVYKGLKGFYNLFDNLDTGDETTGLRLPSGDYDVPIMFTDPLFDRDCQLVFDLFNLDGILGDKFAANGAIQPFMDVAKRRYRLRLYNTSPARWYEFYLYDGRNYLPFWQISQDGNLLPQAVQVNRVRLSNSERADIIVDFSKIQASRLYLVNRLEQVSGRGPTGKIVSPGQAIVQFNVGAAAPDFSRDPAAGTFALRELPDPDMNALLARAERARKREFVFERGNGAWQINGQFYDEDTPIATPAQESEEVWIIANGGGGWAHPVHMHHEEHRVLMRDEVVPRPGVQIEGSIDYARRDVVPLLDSTETRIFMRFRDMKGRYVMHCHNSVHEDHVMMVRFDVV